MISYYPPPDSHPPPDEGCPFRFSSCLLPMSPVAATTTTTTRRRSRGVVDDDGVVLGRDRDGNNKEEDGSNRGDEAEWHLPEEGNDATRTGRNVSNATTTTHSSSAHSSSSSSSHLLTLQCRRDAEATQVQRALERCFDCQDVDDDDGPSENPPTPPQELPTSRCGGGRKGGFGELILVTGPSGCGKTCLARSVVHTTLRQRKRRRPRPSPTLSSSTGDGGLRSWSRRCPNDCSNGDDDVSNNNDGDDNSDECNDSDPSVRNLGESCTRGMLISGKFDQLERREQYYAIVQALTELARQVVAAGRRLHDSSSSSFLRHVRSLLAPHKETVGIVAELVPELRALLMDDECVHDSTDDDNIREEDPDQPPRPAPTATRTPAHSVAPEGGTVARERLQLGLRTLFTVLSSPDHPIVLFLDDLQWADPASLDVLTSFYSGPNPISGLAVIGACRDNEVQPASYLCAILRELEARNVTITQVMVSNVDKTALRVAVRKMLGGGTDDHDDDNDNAAPYESSKASGLTRILHDHTDGNMFFVTQLVRYLRTEGVLYRASERGVWNYESERKVRDTIRPVPDVVTLLARIIRKQQREVQDTLMVASCLGAEFAESVLRRAVAFDVTESLRVAENMQLLRRSSHDAQTWLFVHDRIQESAYSLIPTHEREQIHLRIGRNLWRVLSEREVDVFAHVVVKQLRLGVRLITDPSERELLATLLLRAGELAAKSSAHGTAHEYVTLGIQLLDHRHWRDQYPLSLALYNAAAEIEYCLGNFDRMDALVAEIMENARRTEDKVRAQTARIYSLGTRNELDKAIDVGLWTLRTFFGELLPPTPSTVAILTDLWRTKHLLRRHSDDDLMAMPTMHDFQTLASLRIMCLLLTYAVFSRPTLIPVLAMRIVQHSLRRGLCGMSSIGFGYYGMALTMIFNEVDAGIRYGNVALRIVERFDAAEQLARVSTVVHCLCLSHTKPLSELLPPLRAAHRVGLGSGDIEHSLTAAGLYAMVALYASRPLSDVSDDLSNFLALTSAYNHSGTELMFRPLAQFVECLRGKVGNSSILTGTYLECKSALRTAKETKHGAAAAMIQTFQLVLKHMFHSTSGDAEATAAALIRPGSGLESAPCFMKATVWLHQGLACLAQSHRDGFWSRSRLRLAKQCHRKLVRLSRFSESNYGTKALLLGAEIMVTTGSYHQGLLQYDAAIALAKRSEAWWDAALACERVSQALQSRGRSTESLHYLNQATQYYEEWGATAKVVELKAAMIERGESKEAI